jgi:biotin carboxyl carrier protein
MKQYQITVNGHTFDIRLLSDPRQAQVEVEVNGERFTVAVETSQESIAAPAPSAAIPTRPPEAAVASRFGVTAPLPGAIKSVAVQPGQQVATGDALLVIEAMKMDNVIRASREGIVEAVHVVEGRQVAHGEPLLEYRR